MTANTTLHRLFLAATLLVASSLVAACNGNFAPKTTEPAPSSDALVSSPSGLVGYAGCQSHSLRLDVNVDNRTEKSHLISVWQILASHGQLRVKAIDAAEGQASMRLRLARSCADDECAKTQGWHAAQAALQQLPGVKLACDVSIEALVDNEHASTEEREKREGTKADAKSSEKKADQQSYEGGDATQDEGGVGIEN